MPKFRKKPVVIEALQWRIVNHEQVKAFLGDDYVANLNQHSGKDNHIRIRTLEGPINAAPNDWIIRGVQGEHYPCKPDIFEATYESADTVHEPLAKGHWCEECEFFETDVETNGESQCVACGCSTVHHHEVVLVATDDKKEA